MTIAHYAQSQQTPRLHRRQGKMEPGSDHPGRRAENWMRAMNQATECLRVPSKLSEQALDKSLLYLSHLERILTKVPKTNWGSAPAMNPPPFPGGSDGNMNEHVERKQGTTRLTPSAQPPPIPTYIKWNEWETSSFRTQASINSFQVLTETDDEDDEEEDDKQDETKNGQGAAKAKSPIDCDCAKMDVLRLVVRLCTFQADAQASKATMLARRHNEWDKGARCLQHALAHTRKGLTLADAQISEWYETQLEEDWMQRLTTSDQTTRKQLCRREQRQKDLMDDANIIHVGVQSLLDKRESFILDAERGLHRLRLRLAANTMQREAAKSRMGDSRWKNNPTATNIFARQRDADRIKVEKLERALTMLQRDVTADLKASADQLMTRLIPQRKTRYNGQRPTTTNKKIQNFPDASHFGWVFTGSADNTVEFFEKATDNGSLLKLDFFFSSGTVIISLHHPQHGCQPIFQQKNVSTDLYTRILRDPVSNKVLRDSKKPNTSKKLIHRRSKR